MLGCNLIHAIHFSFVIFVATAIAPPPSHFSSPLSAVAQLSLVQRVADSSAYSRCKDTHRCPRAEATLERANISCCKTISNDIMYGARSDGNVSGSSSLPSPPLQSVPNGALIFRKQMFAHGLRDAANLWLDFDDWRQGTAGLTTVLHTSDQQSAPAGKHSERGHLQLPNSAVLASWITSGASKLGHVFLNHSCEVTFDTDRATVAIVCATPPIAVSACAAAAALGIAANASIAALTDALVAASTEAMPLNSASWLDVLAGQPTLLPVRVRCGSDGVIEYSADGDRSAVKAVIREADDYGYGYGNCPAEGRGGVHMWAVDYEPQPRSPQIPFALPLALTRLDATAATQCCRPHGTPKGDKRLPDGVALGPINVSFVGTRLGSGYGDAVLFQFASLFLGAAVRVHTVGSSPLVLASASALALDTRLAPSSGSFGGASPRIAPWGDIGTSERIMRTPATRVLMFTIVVGAAYAPPIQSIALMAAPGQTLGGTFSFSLPASSGIAAQETRQVRANAEPSAVTAALRDGLYHALAAVDAPQAMIRVTRSQVLISGGYSYNVTFAGAAGDVPLLQASFAELIGSESTDMRTATSVRRGNVIGGAFRLSWQGVATTSLPVGSSSDAVRAAVEAAWAAEGVLRATVVRAGGLPRGSNSPGPAGTTVYSLTLELHSRAQNRGYRAISAVRTGAGAVDEAATLLSQLAREVVTVDASALTGTGARAVVYLGHDSSFAANSTESRFSSLDVRGALVVPGTRDAADFALKRTSDARKLALATEAGSALELVTITSTELIATAASARATTIGGPLPLRDVSDDDWPGVYCAASAPLRGERVRPSQQLQRVALPLWFFTVSFGGIGAGSAADIDGSSLDASLLRRPSILHWYEGGAAGAGCDPTAAHALARAPLAALGLCPMPEYCRSGHIGGVPLQPAIVRACTAACFNGTDSAYAIVGRTLGAFLGNGTLLPFAAATKKHTLDNYAVQTDAFAAFGKPAHSCSGGGGGAVLLLLAALDISIGSSAAVIVDGGDGSDGKYGGGGGEGGTVALVSLHGAIQVDGNVTARGGRGGLGANQLGGGGGAGGTILVVAGSLAWGQAEPTLLVNAVLGGTSNTSGTSTPCVNSSASNEACRNRTYQHGSAGLHGSLYGPPASHLGFAAFDAVIVRDKDGGAFGSAGALRVRRISTSSTGVSAKLAPPVSAGPSAFLALRQIVGKCDDVSCDDSLSVAAADGSGALWPVCDGAALNSPFDNARTADATLFATAALSGVDVARRPRSSTRRIFSTLRQSLQPTTNVLKVVPQPQRVTVWLKSRVDAATNGGGAHVILHDDSSLSWYRRWIGLHSESTSPPPSPPFLVPIIGADLLRSAVAAAALAVGMGPTTRDDAEAALRNLVSAVTRPPDVTIESSSWRVPVGLLSRQDPLSQCSINDSDARQRGDAWTPVVCPSNSPTSNTSVPWPTCAWAYVACESRTTSIGGGWTPAWHGKAGGGWPRKGSKRLADGGAVLWPVDLLDATIAASLPQVVATALSNWSTFVAAMQALSEAAAFNASTLQFTAAVLSPRSAVEDDIDSIYSAPVVGISLLLTSSSNGKVDTTMTAAARVWKWAHGSGYPSLPPLALPSLQRHISVDDDGLLVDSGWNKVDITLDWSLSEYRVRINDVAVVRSRFHVKVRANAVTRVSFHAVGAIGTEVLFDEVYAGDDDTMGFQCPAPPPMLGVHMERNTSDAEKHNAMAPSTVHDWGPADIGGADVFRAKSDHESHISKRRLYALGDHAGLIMGDGEPEIEFNNDGAHLVAAGVEALGGNAKGAASSCDGKHSDLGTGRAQLVISSSAKFGLCGMSEPDAVTGHDCATIRHHPNNTTNHTTHARHASWSHIDPELTSLHYWYTNFENTYQHNNDLHNITYGSGSSDAPLHARWYAIGGIGACSTSPASARDLQRGDGGAPEWRFEGVVLHAANVTNANDIGPLAPVDVTSSLIPDPLRLHDDNTVAASRPCREDTWPCAPLVPPPVVYSVFGPSVLWNPAAVANVSRHNDSSTLGDAAAIVMWAAVDDLVLSRRLAGVATAAYPGGPFTFVRVLRPDGNATVDLALVQDDACNSDAATAASPPAYLVRTFFATTRYVLPQTVMQPLWQSVQAPDDIGGGVDFPLNYHRAAYAAGYDDPLDAYRQSWRGESIPWRVNIIEPGISLVGDDAGGANATVWIESWEDGKGVFVLQRTTLLGANTTSAAHLLAREVPTAEFTYTAALRTQSLAIILPAGVFLDFISLGRPPVGSRYLDPQDPKTSTWRPSSVPSVRAQSWAKNYADGNIADNPPIPAVADLLIGPNNVVGTRRAKFVATTRLTNDYLALVDGGPLVREGGAENCAPLVATLTGSRAAQMIFLPDRGNIILSIGTAITAPHTYNVDVSGAELGFETSPDWLDRHWQYIDVPGDLRTTFRNFRDVQSADGRCPHAHADALLKFAECGVILASDTVWKDAPAIENFEGVSMSYARTLDTSAYEACVAEQRVLLDEYSLCLLQTVCGRKATNGRTFPDVL